jgi:hypothetical protein
MLCELDHGDLMSLVQGTYPNFDLIPVFSSQGLGRYRGDWDWESGKLIKLSEEELLEIYIACKDSWENTR